MRISDWSSDVCSSDLMGYPSLEDFDLLEQRSSDGNCWFVKFRSEGVDEWLLWFGYRTDEMADLLGSQRPWPSIFFAKQTTDPRAVDRKSVVSGKSVSVRVDLGGRRILKKKKNT